MGSVRNGRVVVPSFLRSAGQLISTLLRPVLHYVPVLLERCILIQLVGPSQRQSSSLQQERQVVAEKIEPAAALCGPVFSLFWELIIYGERKELRHTRLQ